jgi:hypothetical protein
MRARPPAQRKGKRSQKVAGNVGGGERFDLIIVAESKSEQVEPLLRRLLSAGELVIRKMALSSSTQWHSGLFI